MVGDTRNLSRPSNLMYANMGGAMELLAVAYVVRLGPDDALPEGFSGPADVWHVHNPDQSLQALGGERLLLARIGSRWIRNTLGAGADLAAAQGVALAHPQGCKNVLRGKLWLAAAPRKTRRSLRDLCRQTQARVQAHLQEDRATLNRGAAVAWRTFDTQRFRMLSDDERRRMPSIVEGAGGTCSAVQ